MAWRLILKRNCSTVKEVVKPYKNDLNYFSNLYAHSEFERETLILKELGKFVPSVYEYESTHLQKWGVGTRYLSRYDYMSWLLRTPMSRRPELYKYIEMNEIYVFGSSPGTMLEHPVMIFRWMPPPEGWWKLNFHGSFKRLPDGSVQAGCGSIIRDASRNIVTYNCVNYVFGAIKAEDVEILALNGGILLALKVDVNKVIIEGHCKDMLDPIMNKKYADKEYVAVYSTLNGWLSKFDCVSVSPVERETNSTAITLAEAASERRCFNTCNIPPWLGLHDLHDISRFRIVQDFELCPLRPLTQG